MRKTFKTMTPEELAAYAVSHKYTADQALNFIVKYHGDDEISDWAEIVEETYSQNRSNVFRAYELTNIID